MTINQEDKISGDQTKRTFVAAAGLIGAIAASSCCIFPLVLFGLGVSGAWIGNFTRLAPYQPCFIVATMALLAYGYWLVYRSSGLACTDSESCARPLPRRIVKATLIVATILVVVALGFDFFAPLLLNS